jgi:hypothetical protein
MNVLITGSSGFIGGALATHLGARGWEVLRLKRSGDGAGGLWWDPGKHVMHLDAAPPLDAVVHLAGESIAFGRWTAAKKARILNSRVEGTRLLAQTLAGLRAKPKVLVSASAIGFYGDRGNEVLDESSEPGDGFLADVCGQWELAAAPAAEAGIRLVTARLGMVLSAAGGALKRMLTPFRLGMGGVLGRGDQYMSWIAIDDVVHAVEHLLSNEDAAGPVNLVAPDPVTNRQFTRTLGKVLHRPTVMPMPAWAARLAFGPMADELLLSSARVMPGRLRATGYTFHLPQLEPALRSVLNRS